MSWDYQSIESGYVVFLTSGCEELPPVDAVFTSDEDAKAYIALCRERAAAEENCDCLKRGLPKDFKPSDILRDAEYEAVRNCWVPFWNDGISDPPTTDPMPIPYWEVQDIVVRADKFDAVDMQAIIRHLSQFVGPAVLSGLTRDQKKMLEEITTTEPLLAESQ